MTGTDEIAIDLAGPRRRDFGRLLIGSIVAHLVLAAAFVFVPEPRIRVPRGVIAVQLVSLPAPARPAAPAPAQPTPPPPAPKRVPKKVVLPAEPTAPLPKPKPKPAVVPKPVAPVKRPPEPEPSREYEDVLAQLRAESGTSQPVPEATAAPVAVAAPISGIVGSPTGVAISPQVASWLKRAKIHVRKNWVVPPGFRTQILEAQVQVDLDSSGRVRGAPRVTRRSGNPWYDEGVVRAIQKSSPLPAPPEAGKWTFVFRPEDSF